MTTECKHLMVIRQHQGDAVVAQCLDCGLSWLEFPGLVAKPKIDSGRWKMPSTRP